MKNLICALCAMLAASSARAEVTVSSSAGRAAVSVIRRVELDYRLVTGKKPVEFDVDGPTWVRVYTRAWWKTGGPDSQGYSLSLWQDDVERPLEFEAGRSSSSWATNRHPVGSWRSFYIQVPAGKQSYRLALNEAALDTVAVRFSLQKPREWDPVSVTDLDRLELLEGTTSETFQRLVAGSSQAFDVAGPCRVRVRVRLNYEPGMLGAQNFVLAVGEKGRELAAPNLRVSRTGSAVWTNAPGELPSSERTVRFRLGEGTHRLELALRGTLARSAGIRVERIVSEKYE